MYALTVYNYSLLFGLEISIIVLLLRNINDPFYSFLKSIEQLNCFTLFVNIVYVLNFVTRLFKKNTGDIMTVVFSCCLLSP